MMESVAEATEVVVTVRLDFLTTPEKTEISKEIIRVFSILKSRTSYSPSLLVPSTPQYLLEYSESGVTGDGSPQGATTFLSVVPPL